ncbi:hypothetical protein [Humidesulfovibrio sp.]
MSGATASIFRPRLGRAIAALLLVLLALGMVSCGKREWPAPQLSEDRFRLRSISVQRGQGCLIVDCELAGAWANLDSVRLHIEAIGDQPGDGCPTCPFVPRISRFFGPGAPEMRRDMNRLIITACDLDPKKTYRVQLVASNVFPVLDLVVSELVISAPL